MGDTLYIFCAYLELPGDPKLLPFLRYLGFVNQKDGFLSWFNLHGLWIWFSVQN